VIGRVAGAVAHARALWAAFVLTVVLEAMAAADGEPAIDD
jgi:hypothetical protein